MPRSTRSLVLVTLLGMGAALVGCGGPPRTDAARARWEEEREADAAAQADVAGDAPSAQGGDGVARDGSVAPRAAAVPVDSPRHPGHTGPRAADGVSPESLVRACYDVISGPAGPRDWERFRALFHPELGRLVPLATRADGSRRAALLRPDDYATHAAATFAAQAFYERALSLEVRRFGGVAQAFSAYAITHDPAPDAPVVDRGVNSFQLCSDGERWYVLSISWDAERPGLSVDDALRDADAR